MPLPEPVELLFKGLPMDASVRGCRCFLLFFFVFFLETEPYTERFMILMAAILWGVFRPSVEWHEGFYQTSMLKIPDNSIHHRRMLIFCPSAASSLPKRGTILFMWPRHGCRLRETSTLQGTNISHLGKRKIIFKMPFLLGGVLP